ncbi:MAG: hypothetical protein JJ921_14920 [Pseudomonadales bacterium]|nr:hypothetical protein [Pseudomonadales bacterium]MBO6703630.1 hypothetical protein [Pseudomonadales bacterium]MBO7004313.1 hypothetical protein [Pseudomonadales bacterium]
MTCQWSLDARYNTNGRLGLDLRGQVVWVDNEAGNVSERDDFAHDTVTHGSLIGLIL